MNVNGVLEGIWRTSGKLSLVYIKKT